MLIGHVASTAIAVEDDGVSVFEHRGIPRPLFRDVHFSREPIAHVLVELLGEKHAAGPMFVGAVAMAEPTGHEDDLLFAVSFRSDGLGCLFTKEGGAGEGEENKNEGSESGFHMLRRGYGAEKRMLARECS